MIVWRNFGLEVGFCWGGRWCFVGFENGLNQKLSMDTIVATGLLLGQGFFRGNLGCCKSFKSLTYDDWKNKKAGRWLDENGRFLASKVVHWPTLILQRGFSEKVANGQLLA